MSGTHKKEKRLKNAKPSDTRRPSIRIIKEAVGPFNPSKSTGGIHSVMERPQNAVVPDSPNRPESYTMAGLTSAGDQNSTASLTEELQRYKAQIHALARELAKVEERELQRFASGLHDHIGQMLFAAKSNLERVIMKDPPSDPANPIYEAIELVNQALLDTRELIVEISPPELYIFGLETAVTSLLEKVEIDYGIRGSIKKIGRPWPLSEELNGFLFRAVRELIFNAVKHAQAANIAVSVHYHEDGIRITVEDDGGGFHSGDDLNEAKAKNGYGLFSLKDRLGFMGGHLKITTSIGNGARVRIVLPHRSAPDAPRGE